MTAGAIVFMLVSWVFVLGLMVWAFRRILSAHDHFDPDGIGPASPPVPPAAPPPAPRGRE